MSKTPIPSATPAEQFEVLLRLAGISLLPGQYEPMLEAYGTLREMVDRLHATRPLESGSALRFEPACIDRSP